MRLNVIYQISGGKDFVWNEACDATDLIAGKDEYKKLRK